MNCAIEIFLMQRQFDFAENKILILRIQFFLFIYFLLLCKLRPLNKIIVIIYNSNNKNDNNSSIITEGNFLHIPASFRLLICRITKEEGKRNFFFYIFFNRNKKIIKISKEKKSTIF